MQICLPCDRAEKGSLVFLIVCTGISVLLAYLLILMLGVKARRVPRVDSTLSRKTVRLSAQNWKEVCIRVYFLWLALFMAINLSCFTLNVRGLNNECKRSQVFRWLHGRKFQIIFLQEVFSSRDIEKMWSAEWGGKVVFCHGTKNSCGTLVLFHPSLDVDVEHVEVG